METKQKRVKDRATPQIKAEPKARFLEQHQRAPGLVAATEPRPRYEATRYRAQIAG